MTAVASSVFTAAQFNTFIRDNLNETAPAKATTSGSYFVGVGPNQIAERTSVTDIIETSETTTSTSYDDLTTLGPQVSVETGSFALVINTADITNNTVGQSGRMTWEVSGASSIAAEDFRALRVTVPSTSGAGNTRASVVTAIGDLTPGMNTFKSVYRASGGTASFANRRLTVLAY